MAFLDTVFGKRYSPKQRQEVEIAKINQSTGKRAISETGRTIRSGISNIAANMGYRTYANKQVAQQQAAATTAAKDRDLYEKAISLYEKMFSGNPDTSGGSGDSSTTEVGGNGSALSSR